MITVKNIYKTFGIQALFEDASLQINARDRYALVGPNGAGKSTLMKMLLGEIEPDKGDIQFKSGITTGYLPQENAPLGNATILEETLAHKDNPDGKVRANAKAILMGLGFGTEDFDRKVNTLSGGWAMRVAMARLLIQEPDLLMLDEPTNHLDLESMFWLQNYLNSYRGAIFLISHDRSFINTVCSAIISLENHLLKPYYGNYEFFLNERDAQRERLEAAYQLQQKEIADIEEFIKRNRARASTANRAQSAINRLEKMERIVLPQESRKIKIRFPQPSRTGIRALTLKNVSKSYGEKKVYEHLNFELERGWKMAFVGHNGAGKSTLLKILADVIPFDDGERILGLNVKVGYFSQHRAEILDPNKTVFEEASHNKNHLSEQLIRTVLGSFLFPGDTVFKRVEVLSGGEKSRLALVKLLLDPPNVLLMDEPTTHLDLQSVEALIEALKEYEGTLCLISHDLYFINVLADHVVHVEHGKVNLYPGNYEYFERRQKQKLAEFSELEIAVPSLPSPAREKRMHPKELRRQRALEREKLRQQKQEAQHSRPLGQMDQKNNFQNDLTEIKMKIEELTKQLEDPTIYEDYSKVMAITNELKTLQDQLNSSSQN